MSLSTHIVTKLIGAHVSLKARKSGKGVSPEVDETPSKSKLNSFAEYALVVRKQVVRSSQQLLFLFQSLFKAIAIQMSHFVNVNNKVEIDQILNQIYVYLCTVQMSGDHFYTNTIMLKFVQSNCFSSQQSPVSTPTKTATNGVTSSVTVNVSFLQFAFKYLIHFETNGAGGDVDPMMLTQLRTIQLLSENIEELILQP